MTCPDANRLGQLGDGVLAEAERATVERHLDGCAACGVVVAELAWIYAPAPTARAWREAGPRTPAEIVGVWRRAIAAVAARHRAARIHGELSADHVLVAADGDVVITDPLGAPARPSAVVAPERLHGGPASAAADQFSLCAAAWEALAGAPAFSGATAGALAVQMMTPPVIPAAGDRATYAVLARGLAPDPAGRWPGLDALLVALDRPRGSRRRLVVLVVAGAAAIAAALGIVAATRG